MTSSKLSSVCSSCQQGKSHRLHFSYSPSISSNPLQLLFIDVWDPTSITSVNNNCFYLSIVDDFSKYTRFYPLKLKSDVCAIFLHFKQLVETYFGTKIISVQSDNGGEFRPLQTSLTAMECPISLVVHIHIIKWSLLKEIIDILLKLVSPFLLLPLYLSLFGTRLLRLQSIS
jgi:hypothetical protein